MSTAITKRPTVDDRFGALKPGLFDLKLMWRFNESSYDTVISDFQTQFVNWIFENCNKPNFGSPDDFLVEQIKSRPPLLGYVEKDTSFVTKLTSEYLGASNHGVKSTLMDCISSTFSLEYEQYIQQNRNFGAFTFFDLDFRKFVRVNGRQVLTMTKVIPVEFNGGTSNYEVKFIFHRVYQDDPHSVYLSEIQCPTLDEAKQAAEEVATLAAIQQVADFQAAQQAATTRETLHAFHGCVPLQAAEGGSEDEDLNSLSSEDEDDTASIPGGQCLQRGSLSDDNSDTEHNSRVPFEKVPGVDTPASSGDSIISLEDWRNRATNGDLSIDEIQQLLREKKKAVQTPKKGTGKKARSNLTEAISLIKESYNLEANTELRDLIQKLELTKQFGL
tara:strand:- start:2866 stop:4029 length:1164 start_codon:yes stop_codon:yes gene_type:complete